MMQFRSVRYNGEKFALAPCVSPSARSNLSLSAISYKRYISEPILCFKSAVLNSPLFDSTDSSF